MIKQKNKQFIKIICIFASEINQFGLAFALIYSLTLTRINRSQAF